MTVTYVMGIDLGSTGIKVLIADRDGAELVVEQAPTPWIHGPGGTAELDDEAVLATVLSLCARACEHLDAHVGRTGATVSAVAVTGMGESGFVIDDDGRCITRAIAWFDPRGADQVASLPPAIAAAFPGRTGLPLGVQVSATKLAYLRDAGVNLAGHRWVNMPEWLVARLGGEVVAERSLASRTGLIDQDSGEPWPDLLRHLGVDASFIPPLVNAGTLVGRADHAGLPDGMRLAALTVAGHDHLVAASAAGRMPTDRFHVSMGTAEVILQVLERPLPATARDRLARYFINHVSHVEPGQHVLVAGVKTGLLMRRALELFGVTTPQDRDALDARAAALPPGGSLPDGAVAVAGARNDDGVLSLTVRADGATPAEVFAALLAHGNDEIRILLDAMAREIAPPAQTVMSGGWTRMASVRAARSRVLPDLTVSTRSQDTAAGAARFAASVLDGAPHPLGASRH